MIGRSGERGSWISVRAARHDDDDDDDEISIWLSMKLFHISVSKIWKYGVLNNVWQYAVM